MFGLGGVVSRKEPSEANWGLGYKVLGFRV